MFIKSNNLIKIYHVPWVNSPNTEEQLRDTEGMFHRKQITEKTYQYTGTRNNPGTGKTFPAVVST